MVCRFCSLLNNNSHGSGRKLETMFDGSKLRHVFSFLFLHVLPGIYAAAQYACNGAAIVDIVVLKTIHIQTYITYNTTFPVDEGLTISVQNAPTNYDLTTTYTLQSMISRIPSRYFRFSCGTVRY